MKSIYQDLLNENKEDLKEMGRINSKSEFSKDKNRDTLRIPVWFNPWRYENEEHIVIPLLLQIQQTLSETLEKSNFSKNDKKKFREEFDKTVRALIYGFSGKLSLGVVQFSFSA